MNQKDIDIYNEIKDNPIVQSYKKLLDEWVKEYESKDPKKEFYKEDNGISYFICLPYDKVGISAGKLVNVHHKYSAVGLDEKGRERISFCCERENIEESKKLVDNFIEEKEKEK